MMPRRDHEAIEAEMKARGLTAPAVTLELVRSKVKEARYHHFEGTTVTLCLLILENGFTVVGESACASAANFVPEMGRDLAYKDAFEKIWKLEGYLLRERLFTEEN